MSKFRESFVKQFGEENATAIQIAASEHTNGINDKTGSDTFRWAILICIGSECISRFAEYHEITCAWEEVAAWLKTQKEYLGEHDGDVDYLAMFAGIYNEFIQ